MLNMKMAFRLWVAAIILLTALAISENTAVAIGECPAVGANSDCGTIITIVDNGLSILHTGRGPYDTIDDTLVGVVNNRTTSLSSIGLVSGLPIFAFDNDGICGISPITGLAYSPRPSGCSFGPTTYEGPGVGFTNISADFKQGTVTFLPPIAPGGTAYFSLEENINTAPNDCPDGINFSLATFISDGGRPNNKMNATFTPRNSSGVASTSEAAQNCGFQRFNWISEITVPAPVPYFQNPIPPSTTPTRLSPGTYNDPVERGYDVYIPASGLFVPDTWNSFPYFWDVTINNQPYSLSDTNVPSNGNLTATTLKFSDTPSDNCLPGGTINAVLCGVPPPPALAPPGSKLTFKTRVVGIRNGPPVTPVELGIFFTWESAFNGFSGGVSRTANLLDADPGIGTGGITITEVHDVTNYQYNGIAVTTVNGALIVPAITVSATPKKLWPPNKFMVPVTVSGTMTEPGGAGVNPSTAAYVVLDEYGLVQPKGAVSLSADGSYSFTIQLQASRNGNDKDGRQYHITVSGEDNVGNMGSSSTLVIVPHDQRSDHKH